jgi:hypothetical protein
LALPDDLAVALGVAAERAAAAAKPRPGESLLGLFDGGPRRRCAAEALSAWRDAVRIAARRTDLAAARDRSAP